MPGVPARTRTRTAQGGEEPEGSVLPAMRQRADEGGSHLPGVLAERAGTEAVRNVRGAGGRSEVSAEKAAAVHRGRGAPPLRGMRGSAPPLAEPRIGADTAREGHEDLRSRMRTQDTGQEQVVPEVLADGEPGEAAEPLRHLREDHQPAGARMHPLREPAHPRDAEGTQEEARRSGSAKRGEEDARREDSAADGAVGGRIRGRIAGIRLGPRRRKPVGDARRDRTVGDCRDAADAQGGKQRPGGGKRGEVFTEGIEEDGAAAEDEDGTHGEVVNRDRQQELEQREDAEGHGYLLEGTARQEYPEAGTRRKGTEGMGCGRSATRTVPAHRS